MKRNDTLETWPETIHETKQEFNSRYGKWLQDIRTTERNETIESVAAATGLDADTLAAMERGVEISLYDALKLCEYYDIEG